MTEDKSILKSICSVLGVKGSDMAWLDTTLKEYGNQRELAGRIDELRKCNEKMERFRSKHLDETTVNRRSKQTTNENINLFRSINNRRVIELQTKQ